jgi:hypothetical protein
MLLLAAVSAGCGSSTKPDEQPIEGPDYANDSVLRMAQHVSSRVEALFVVRSIESLVDQTHQVVNAAKAATGSGKPTAHLTLVSQHLHVNFEDLDSWKQTGLRTDTPLLLAFGHDPVVIAEVADEERLQTYLKSLDDSELRISDESWTIKDGVAYIALDNKSDLAAVIHQEDAFSAGSLVEDVHFREFRERILGNHLLGMYVPRGSELMGEVISETVREFSRYRGPLAPHILWGMFAHVQGFGMAAGVDGGSVRAEAWLGMTEDARAKASAFIDSPRAEHWERHLLQDTALFWGTSIDAKLGWDWIAYAMKSKTRRDMREAFEKLSEEKKVDFDIERDLVNHLSGHGAMMIHPLTNQAPRYASMTLGDFGMIFMFTFTDPVVPKRLAQVIQDATSHQQRNTATVRLADGQAPGGTVRVIDFGSVHAPKIYAQDRLVAFAASGFDEATMVELFNNTDRTKRLANADGHALAKTMLSSVEKNTLYLNGAPFFAKLRQTQAGDIGPWADLLDEALVTLRVSDTGLVAEGELRSAAALGFAPYAFNREIIEDQARSTRYRLQKLSREAMNYYVSRQNACDDPDSCSDPWHADVRGRFVSKDDQKVFPGGLNQEWHSHPEIPKAARHAKMAPTARQHAEATMKRLGFNEQESSPFRITYITNGVSGPGAQVILRAEADFDPSTPERHTLEQTITVGVDGRISTSQVVQTNEFE